MTQSKRILIIMSSNSDLGLSGKQTGTWFEEIATPYYIFQQAGHEVVLASPKGGKAPIDLLSLKAPFATPNTDKFLKDAVAMFALENTRILNTIDASTFDAIFFPGGYSLLWDLASNQLVIKIVKDFYNDFKPIAFVCHAPAILRDVRLDDGSYLIKELNITGFTNEEEKEIGLGEYLLFSLEDDLKMRGANYTKKANWQGNVVVDKMILTGQNPASAPMIANELVEMLNRS